MISETYLELVWRYSRLLEEFKDFEDCFLLLLAKTGYPTSFRIGSAPVWAVCHAFQALHFLVMRTFQTLQDTYLIVGDSRAGSELM